MLGLLLFGIFGCWIRLAAAPPSGIPFIENKKQWPATVDAGARLPGGHLLVTAGAFHFQFLHEQQVQQKHLHHHGEAFASAEACPWIDGVNATLEFVGASANSQAVPFGPLPTYYNFFQGNDTSRWAGKARSFEEIVYSDLYPGIDLKLYSQGQALKYDWVVAPFADPSVIQWTYHGADRLTLADGSLQVQASFASWQEMKPLAYQEVGGRRVDVDVYYELNGATVSFCFPNGYDRCLPLVIDPLLIFSTYSGSEADNWGSTATPGERGTLYSSGVTNHFVTVQGPQNLFSGTFPATTGSFQTSYGGLFDIGILKYDSTGSDLLYATYLGGSQSESPHSLVMNANNELIVLGTTSSLDFPVSANAYDKIFTGGAPVTNVVNYTFGTDLFVARISADGSALLASTYLGQAGNDGVNPRGTGLVANYGDELRGDVIADADGNVYLSSVTSSVNWVLPNGFSTTYRGGNTDGLVLKMNEGLSEILWGNFLGGIGTDASHTIQLDSEGNVYLAGGTTSADFPVTTGSYQTQHKGNAEGWIARISSDGTQLLQSTFTGTPQFDQVYFVDLNSSNEVFVYGQTGGSFSVTAGVYHNPNSGQFLQKFSTDLSTLIFSTVFGSGRGEPDISPTAFLVNDCNNIYMSGWGGILNNAFLWANDTRGMPVTPDAVQSASNGSDFYFMVLTDDASEFLYGTYLGGNQSATHVDGGTSRFDKSGIVYHAVCAGCRGGNLTGGPTSDFPTTGNVWSKTNNSLNCNNAAFKFDLSSLRARIQTNSVALNRPGLGVVCLPDEVVFQNLSTGGRLYEWQLGDGTFISRSDTSLVRHLYPEPGRYTIRLKAIDQGTCVGADSTAVTIDVSEVVPEVSPNADICFGSNIGLTASGGVAYEWRTDTGMLGNAPSLQVSPEDTTSYYVQVTNTLGCIARDTVVVQVVPAIDVAFEFAKVYDCDGRPLLQVRNLTEVQEDETFTFDFGDGTLSNDTEATHVYAADGAYTVTLAGRKEFCVYEKSEEVPVFTISVPNVITPADQNQRNDALRITFGNPPQPDTDLLLWLRVYNRWGQLVYENKDYQNDWAAEGLANGVYYYELEIAGETSCKSWIHVMK